MEKWPLRTSLKNFATLVCSVSMASVRVGMLHTMQLLFAESGARDVTRAPEESGVGTTCMQRGANALDCEPCTAQVTRFRASETCSAATMAFVVAIAGMMLPAMLLTFQRDCKGILQPRTCKCTKARANSHACKHISPENVCS